MELAEIKCNTFECSKSCLRLGRQPLGSGNTTVVERSRSQSSKSQLQNGTTVIKFDFPRDDFEDILINIQLEGDCNGVFISKKTREGFEVKELQKGKSDIEFSWKVINE